MAPILIDNRGLLKLGSIFFLTLVIVFGAGFLSGFQQADSVYNAGNETAALSLPEPETVSSEHLEQQLPESTSAGAEIDVDRPELETLLVAAAPVDTDKGSASTGATSVQVSKQNIKTEVIASDSPESTVSKKAEDNATLKQVASAQVQPDPDEPATTTISKARPSATKIRYTIQIGMYGRLLNADNLVAMLKAQQVNAYVSEFVNRKNEVRYNVRFGYFSDKKSALAALKDYKDKQKGEGYLVNFSRKDLTNLADAEEAKPVVEEGVKDNVSAPKSETQNSSALEKTTTSAVSPELSNTISDEGLIVVTQ